MDPIYVTGHRNPDTDSIVAAIAYAALRNACGDREYEAACLGRVSDETRIVLDRFGFRPPMMISNLFNQVRDLEFDTPPILATGVTMGRAWDEFREYPSIAAVPVVRENGTLYGVLSRTDIEAGTVGHGHASCFTVKRGNRCMLIDPVMVEGNNGVLKGIEGRKLRQVVLFSDEPR